MRANGVNNVAVPLDAIERLTTELAAARELTSTQGAKLHDIAEGFLQRAEASEAREKALREVAKEVDRWFLVIESAVRTADGNNRPGVLAALKANRGALNTGAEHD